ncbi:adenosylmethionine--8-amino-7-oxononanoate transaminase [Urechidicola vernalis]|uniref:Adenosylmethionine-8-amino-7-oxononanoate aminotransferase n=1 Tax=Urechidicola vernalis TaxID=3075600 RepID=A0ABU2Y7T1_9FLAO|nr:adenosylmethionine--8-amino-7-oxononanoate transaminase [Urechidicola sp. P050]MDT0554255.1 adenosylmethionine--8-amino-7-oxononanoate transaminase [Urechidicola sp. P050]
MSLQERDKKHLWHPLTQHKIHPNHLPIVSAKGCILTDDKGNEYIDAIASWYTCMYGHCNEFITSKVKEGLDTLDQVVFSGYTHKPAIELSEALMDILPKNQQKIFFSDNGSTSVDVAIKMALQYHFNQGEKRGKIVALEGGFHGDTFGAMSVSGLSVYNGPFEDFFIDVARIPIPNKDNIQVVIDQFETLVKNENVAAFIFEPLVQGASAMYMYDAHLLDELIAIAHENGVVTIADEVMTGFGKTGKNFASEHLNNKPEIICLSKSLTGGIAPMALTTCSQKIYDAFYADEIGKGFFHGHTYSANPLACNAALASMKLLQTEEMQENIQRVIQSHKEFNTKVKDHPKVKSTRQLGIIFALDLNIEMERYGNLRDKLFQHFMRTGVFLRPLGNTIYILAPFTISKSELQKVYKSIEQALEIV